MTKTKSIRKYCLGCAGTPKDVAFCIDPQCSLWEHRLGVDLRSNRGIEMMRSNCQKYPKDFADLAGYGVDPSLYQPGTPRRIGPSLLNEGLLAFKSRQKELAQGKGIIRPVQSEKRNKS